MLALCLLVVGQAATSHTLHNSASADNKHHRKCRIMAEAAAWRTLTMVHTCTVLFTEAIDACGCPAPAQVTWHSGGASTSTQPADQLNHLEKCRYLDCKLNDISNSNPTAHTPSQRARLCNTVHLPGITKSSSLVSADSFSIWPLGPHTSSRDVCCNFVRSCHQRETWPTPPAATPREALYPCTAARFVRAFSIKRIAGMFAPCSKCSGRLAPGLLPLAAWRTTTCDGARRCKYSASER